MSKNDTMSYVFDEEELATINEVRNEYENMSEREKFIIKEALKVYFYTNKK